MIEVVVREFLDHELNVDVFLQYPSGRKARRFIVLEKVGSSRENFLNRASIAIQSYEEDLYWAARLNEVVKEAMGTLAKDSRIGAVRLISDYNFTDLEMKRYRYQAVYEIYYYDV